ncbi:hypothetical protein [Veillonella sp. AS16]|uniref:hypothetical protein n=1 Tax=Veillonella sp. AS16 TaxID=936589 RepID=UPI0003E292D0|nr:hypothetical protein [Veillonella sp. AS16]ETS91723.1 hypothetical protein HMPREF1521_1178 [Veillonella sp. AS16]
MKEVAEFVIDEISERHYWFVRTNGGEYYDDYFHEGYIAVGFNSIIDKSVIEKAETDDVYKRALYEKIKLESETDEEIKIKPGLIINQLKRFIVEMNPGDIVLIPSENSKFISFGEITSDVEIINPDDVQEDGCPFIKRRKVKWVKTLKKESLDPYLYKAIMSHHVITDVSDSATFINRSMSTMYVENGRAHITLRVESKESVKIADINTLLTCFEDIATKAEFPTEILDPIAKADLKINVQSPGPVEYITFGAGLLGFGAILVAISLYRAGKIIEKVGGSCEFKIGLKGVAFKMKANSPTTSAALDTEQLVSQIINSPEAMNRLKQVVGTLEKLETKLPNEKDGQD